jgi:hypothetical protein
MVSCSTMPEHRGRELNPPTVGLELPDSPAQPHKPPSVAFDASLRDCPFA